MNSKGDYKDFRWLRIIKQLPCAICSKNPPSLAHHIKQNLHFIAIPLCYDCHMGQGGVHGDKSKWRTYLDISKKNEYSIINETIKKGIDILSRGAFNGF